MSGYINVPRHTNSESCVGAHSFTKFRERRIYIGINNVVIFSQLESVKGIVHQELNAFYLQLVQKKDIETNTLLQFAACK